ncbi:MAG: protein kinase [Acidobacteria bacterium]|nr:protein kinase [Acidobacteriota bacterium]
MATPDAKRKDLEDRILLRAIEAGLIEAAEVDAAGPLQDRDTVYPWGPRVSALVRTGKLSESAVEWLAQEDPGIQPSLSSQPTDVAPGEGGGRGASRAVGENDGSPSRRLGKYELGIVLGQGGMGRVYMAYDTVLKRSVALKFLLVENGATPERFFQEARAQARVDHEYVCRIYEAGEIDRTPYIAMQYIAGSTLTFAALEMNLDQKMDVMRKVAEGVNAAHATGLIHRDLKPGNILVQRTEDGVWKPYVMDFGLARELQSDGLTSSGMVMGTFAYMAPEQARGEVRHLDRRTDVYGLGATMYEILSGAPPFSGGSGADILVDVLQKDPKRPRLRDPRIPIDAETITMKCLEKNPEKRYQSAKALADDLNRFLQGDPILARRATVPERVWKRIRKYPVFSSIIAAAVLAVIVLTGIAVVTSYRAKEAGRLMQEFGQEVKEVEAIMRFAYLLPLHDISPQDALVRARLREIEGRMEQIGRIAQGPGHYALGRGYMALREYEDARSHLESAWNEHGYQPPVVAYALGLTLTNLYQERLKEVQRITVKQEREARLASLDREYRDPAKNFIRAAGAHLESREYADALVAMLDKNYEAALAKAEMSYRTVPWLYEARQLEGDVYLTMANQKRDEGRNDEAAVLYEKAEAAYADALSRGSSDPAAYESAASLQVEVMRMQIYQTARSPRGSFEKALAACESALAAQPHNPRAYGLRSSAYVRWGEYEAQQGEDPRPTFLRSIESAEAAVRQRPGDVLALTGIGTAWWRYGRYEAQLGGDPAESFTKAADAYRKAARIEASALTYANLGGLYWNRASEESRAGRRSSEWLDRAAECLEKALELNPAYGPAHNNLGLVYLEKAELAVDGGGDVRPFVRSAAERLQKGIALNPTDAYACSNLGSTFLVLGMYESLNGSDPRGSLAQSIAAYERAHSINPNWPSPYFGIGAALNQRAQYELETGIDPTADINASLEALDRCLRIDANQPDVYTILGRVRLLDARWLIKAHRSPEAALDSARTLMLKAGAKDAEANEALGELFRWRAEWRLSRRESAASDIKQGIVYADRALSLSPSLADAHAVKGALLLLQANAGPAGSPRCAAGAEAAREIQEANRLNANLQARCAQELAAARSLCSGSSK